MQHTSTQPDGSPVVVGPTPRARRQTTHNWLRQFNQRFLSPVMRFMAGRRGWYCSLLMHVGRHSGATYRTPVIAVPVSDGFLIPLPYGPDTDWCLNVRAAGGCTIKHKASTYRVYEPEVTDATAAKPLLSPMSQRLFQWLRFPAYLRVKYVDRASAASCTNNPDE